MRSLLAKLLLASVGEKRFTYLRYLKHRTFGTLGYDTEYYRAISDANKTCYPIFARAIVAEFSPKSLVDVGCGSGEIALAFVAEGCTSIFPFDYSSDAVALAKTNGLNQALEIDLTRASRIPAVADLCLCLEVAEHIPAANVANLCKLLSEPAPVLIFTAAPPGQGGHFHLNEQPRQYWIENLRVAGMHYDEQAVVRVRERFAGRMIPDYDNNLMIFRRDAIFSRAV